MARRGNLTPEDRRIWSRVAGSVTPSKRRKPARVTAEAPLANAAPALSPQAPAPALTPPAVRKPSQIPSYRPPVAAPSPVRAAHAQPETLEPRRQRRLSRERDRIEATLDLHGFGRFEAEDQLRAFLLHAHARGHRAVLVVTGQGRRGGGVIRASIVEWLQSQRLRGVVSGYAFAHRRHGGEGAVYVTLRRRD